MRELALTETGYLAGLLILSLVLPLLMSFRGLCTAPDRRSGTRIVWLGQTLVAFAAIVVLASSPLASYAAGFGLVSCIACALVLLSHFRASAPGV